MTIEEQWRAALQELHSTLFKSIGQDSDKSLESVSCPLCNSRKSKTYCKKDGMHYAKCSECSFVYMNPRLSVDATLGFYNSKANEIYNTFKFHAQNSVTAKDDELNQNNLNFITQVLGGSNLSKPLLGVKMLEIGSAKGHLLKLAQNMGADVYGVELNKKNVELSKAALGDVIFDKDILSLQLPNDSYDLIYLRDVIEHIHNPMEFLKELARLLKSGGVIFFETHNIDGLIHRIVKEKHTCIFGFEHPVHWSPATLGRALQTLGFSIERVEFDSLGLTVSEILRYFINPTFTTIYPWRPKRWQVILVRTILKINALPLLRQIDGDWLQRFANSMKMGSTFKLVAKKYD